MTAVKDYEELLKTVIRDMTAAFEKRQGEPLNLAAWMIFIAYVSRRAVTAHTDQPLISVLILWERCRMLSCRYYHVRRLN